MAPLIVPDTTYHQVVSLLIDPATNQSAALLNKRLAVLARPVGHNTRENEQTLLPDYFWNWHVEGEVVRGGKAGFGGFALGFTLAKAQA